VFDFGGYSQDQLTSPNGCVSRHSRQNNRLNWLGRGRFAAQVSRRVLSNRGLGKRWPPEEPDRTPADDLILTQTWHFPHRDVNVADLGRSPPWLAV
jgi:hypothetical protein